MKNYFEFRGLCKRIVYEQATGQFTALPVKHPFAQQLDPADEHRARDCDSNISMLERGKLRVAAEEM